VLWLLHGTFGDHTDWLRKSNIELYACEKQLIVVMPSALNSYYSNWDRCMMGYGMYDFLTEELMPLVYSWFPASDKREDNFISGLSMGGGGTLKYALGHPNASQRRQCSRQRLRLWMHMASPGAFRISAL
jgi:putative tributyrin esterase